MNGFSKNGVVVAVIVTFNPSIELLSSALLAINRQVSKIVIVDNASDIDIAAEESVRGEVELIRLESNRGLACAQNVGINWAIENGCNFVLLMDQDSVPREGMVRALKDAHHCLIKRGSRVAAVGPHVLARNGVMKSAFSRVSGFRLFRIPCQKDQMVSTDYLISSGSLISSEVFGSVGLMRDDLFIDYIDIEWCLRAKSLGYDSFGVCNAVLSHALGDEPLNIFGLLFPLHSPLRHYYIFRNAILLYRDPMISFQWRVVDAYRLIFKFLAYALFTDNRWKHISMMLRGLRDGFSGRGGNFVL